MESLTNLVQRARDGDRDAFALIVGQLSRQAVATAHLITGDLQVGEEAAQDAFVTAWKKLGSLREPAAFRSWFGVVLARTACRARRPRRDRTLPEDLAAPVRERTSLPEIALGLSDAHREVLALRYVDDLPYQDIAGALGLTVVRVKSRLHEAREILRERYLRGRRED
jgi:RNA polymerase sigma-70 factor (ECF subfamily)